MQYIHKIEEFPNEARLDELSRENWEPFLVAGQRVIFRRPLGTAAPERFIPESHAQEREQLNPELLSAPGGHKKKR